MTNNSLKIVIILGACEMYRFEHLGLFFDAILIVIKMHLFSVVIDITKMFKFISLLIM